MVSQRKLLNNLFLILFLFCGTITYSQIGIGTNDPQATLDVREADPNAPTSGAGISVPQVSVLPARGNRNGQIVFNTTKNRYYYFEGTTWVPLNAYSLPEIKNITTSYTLLPIDSGVVFTANSATDITVNVPSNLPVGFNISLYQTGNGKVTFTGSFGVLVLNRLQRFTTAGQQAAAGLICTSSNTFFVTGDLVKN